MLRLLLHLALIATSVFLIAGPQLSFAQCTQEQAMNKMLVLGRHSSGLKRGLAGLNKETKNRQYMKIAQFSRKFAPGGKLINEKRFNEACVLYDQIAKEFNVDMDTPSNTLTVKDLKRGAASSSDGCDVAQASKNMNALRHSFYEPTRNKQFNRLEKQEFSDIGHKIGEMMYSDPSKACEMIADTKAKFKL